MSHHGHHCVAVLTGVGRGGQEPLPAGPPEQPFPGAAAFVALRGRRQVIACSLDAGLASKAAREFTGQTLGGWGLPALDEDAAVIVSELVTNALRHGARGLHGEAHDRVELILWRQPGQVICVVTDPGARSPVLVPPDPLAEAGRGLRVVEALSATWGWTRLGGHRKAVWAVLRAPGAAGSGENCHPRSA